MQRTVLTIAFALIMAGCTTDEGTPVSTATTANGTASTVVQADATDEEAQASTTTAATSDDYFALDRVLDISIEIAEEDWDALRHQTWTVESLRSEIEEHGLSRPFSQHIHLVQR